jgi:hypothetical protein
MSIFWLSFTDPSRPAGDRHLHIITGASDLDAADAIARGLGAVGDVSMADLDGCDPMPPTAFVGRVLADSDIDAMESAMAPRSTSSPQIAQPKSHSFAVAELPPVSGRDYQVGGSPPQ